MKRFLSAGIVFLCLLITGCEKEQLVFKDIDFNISEYILPGYFITSIDFDSKGNAWIGTFRQGLIKYDGKSETVYNSGNSILPDSQKIWDLKVDHDDNIWLGTEGLVKFDGESFEIYNTSNSPLLEDFVSSIAIDQNNVVWLASCRHNQGGLMSFNGITWKSYTPENSQIPGNLISDIAIDKNNNIWLALSESIHGACLVKISKSKWTIYDDSDLGFQPYYFNDLAVGKNNIIIASIDYGLSSLMDISRPNIIQFNGNQCIINNPVDEQNNSLGYVGVMNTDSRGNIWVSIWMSKNIIAAYNGQNWYFNDDPDSPVESFFAIESDPLDRIWIGTGNGIFIIEQY